MRLRMNRENNNNTSSTAKNTQAASSGLQQKLTNFLEKGTHTDQEIMAFCEKQSSGSNKKNSDNE